jgi:hypothetical protein
MSGSCSIAAVLDYRTAPFDGEVGLWPSGFGDPILTSGPNAADGHDHLG